MMLMALRKAKAEAKPTVTSVDVARAENGFVVNDYRNNRQFVAQNIFELDTIMFDLFEEVK